MGREGLKNLIAASGHDRSIEPGAGALCQVLEGDRLPPVQARKVLYPSLRGLPSIGRWLASL
eukprot:15454277-Alexandrium_andersonii.AAC.1